MYKSPVPPQTGLAQPHHDERASTIVPSYIIINTSSLNGKRGFSAKPNAWRPEENTSEGVEHAPTAKSTSPAT